MAPKSPSPKSQISYTVHFKGNGTLEQLLQVRDIVRATAPNRFNVADTIKLNSNTVPILFEDYSAPSVFK